MDKTEIREIIAAALNEALSEKERKLAATRAQAEFDAKLAQLADVQAELSAKSEEASTLAENVQTAQTSLEELAAEKEAMTAELATLKAELEADRDTLAFVATEKEELAAKLDAVTAELSESQAVASALKDRLDAIDAEALLASRLETLQSSNVLRAGAALDAQKVKVVALSDEEFSAYVADLVALRNEIVASLAHGATDTTGAAPVTTEMDLASRKSDPIKLGEAISKLIMKKEDK